MRQKRVQPSLVGETLAASIRVPSPSENSQYLLRIDSGSTLTETHVQQLQKADVQTVRIGSPGDPEEVVDERLDQEEERVVNELQTIEKSIKDDSFNANDLKAMRTVLDGMVDTLMQTDALTAFTGLKSHDTYTAQHSFDVARLTLGMAMENETTLLQIAREESGATTSEINRHLLTDIGLGALLHDIGKWKIDEEILNKNGSLTDEEWETIKAHPRAGYELLRDLDKTIRAPVLAPVLHHHEEWSGNGYPTGRAESNIHWTGRLVKVCDVYSALTSDRPYRKALSPAAALNEMDSMKDSFDRELWDLFRSNIAPFPPGSEVRLPGNLEGIVIDLENGINKPTVLITHRNGTSLAEFKTKVVSSQQISDATGIEALAD